jgi:glycosyltransferase involved in cell wall biosynthesis
VSRATRRELVDLGVGADRIAIVHNGVTPVPDPGVERTPHPSMCLVSRLVPHKQVEHAIDAVVRLREEMPDLTLTVVGSGWWEAELHAHAEQVGAGDSVIFTGHVTDAEKHAVYARSWVMALPSLKEGWGLVIGEAGLHATPAVAYASAGGTQESIIDDYSGLLAEDWEGFVSSLRLVLSDAEQRAKLAAGARTISDEYTWEHAQGSFAEVLAAALDGRRTSTQDPNEIPAG